MKKCILIAGAAALAFAAPAFAGPGNGHGGGGNAHAASAHVNAGEMAPGHRHNSMTDGDAHGTRAHGWHQAALHNHGRL